MRVRWRWILFFSCFLVACSARDNRPRHKPAPIKGAQANSPRLSDENIRALINYLHGNYSYENDDEFRAKKDAALEKLEIISPGWADKYLEILSDAGLGETEAELKATDKALSKLSEQLSNDNPSHVGIQILIQLLKEYDERDFEALTVRFAAEAQFWAWRAIADFAYTPNIEAAHRCLSLDRNYPRCKELFEEAVRNYPLVGCKQENIKVDIQLFGASSTEGTDKNQDSCRVV